MIALGAWLVVTGACDLLRATRDTITTRHRVLLVGLGFALFAMALLVLDVTPRAAPLGVIWSAGLAAWLITSSAALDASATHRPAWRAAAFTALGVTAGGLLLVGDAVSVGFTVPSSLDGTLLTVPLDELVLVVGVGLFQLSSANIVVRLLLDAVGVPAVTNEKKLKGGRVLGPMERLFIILLGHGGQLGAAAIVVAAKGLLRYPELQRTEREEGPTDVSEYFLIGSFASWLLALAGLIVIQVS
ncbi:MAG: hypothetical protein ACXWXO_00100 [Nocardioides sp.]